MHTCIVLKITSSIPVAARAGGHCNRSDISRPTSAVATATLNAFSAVSLERMYRRGISTQ